MAQPQQPPPLAPPAPQTNGMAVAGLVCGIIGLVLFWTVWGGVILGVLGVIFGAIGMGTARARGGAGRGMALAGVICGGLGILLSILWIVAIAAIFVESGVDIPFPSVEPPE